MVRTLFKTKKPHDYKIYIAGYFQAGKSTMVHSLDPNAISIDKPIRKELGDEKSSTTIGFDLGHLIWSRPNEKSDGVIMSEKEFEREKKEYNGWIHKKIEIKGSPGQLHFKDVREMVAKSSDGVLFVIDSADPAQIGNALTLLTESRCLLGENIPMVILANKQDLDNRLSPEEISNLIKEDTYGASGKYNHGLKEAVIRLLRIIVGEITQNLQH